MTTYSESLKEQMVRRLLTPPGMSVRELAQETGISKSVLWKWRSTMGKTSKPGEKEWMRVPRDRDHRFHGKLIGHSTGS